MSACACRTLACRMEEAVAQLMQDAAMLDAAIHSHRHAERLAGPRSQPLERERQWLERELGEPHAPRERAVRPTPLFDSCEEIALALIDSRFLTPLIDSCDEMVQALVFSPFLKMPACEEGMKLMPWLEAVFELYEDAPFLKVDMIEFKKAKASPIVQQLDFLYRTFVDPLGYPDPRGVIYPRRGAPSYFRPDMITPNQTVWVPAPRGA